jgi:hypothetical protein
MCTARRHVRFAPDSDRKSRHRKRKFRSAKGPKLTVLQSVLADRYHPVSNWGSAWMVCDLLQKIELIHAAGTQFNPPDAREVVKTLYEVLTILDTKGLALLAFDGIIVAATTFVAERGGVFQSRGTARALAVLVIVLALVASVACLFVSEISYPFLYHVACSAPHSLDYTQEINRLTNLVDWRTNYFQLAWWCSLIAIPLFLMLFGGHCIGKRRRNRRGFLPSLRSRR